MRFWKYIKGMFNEENNSSNDLVENLPNLPSDQQETGQESNNGMPKPNTSNQKKDEASEDNSQGQGQGIDDSQSNESNGTNSDNSGSEDNSNPQEQNSNTPDSKGSGNSSLEENDTESNSNPSDNAPKESGSSNNNNEPSLQDSSNPNSNETASQEEEASDINRQENGDSENECSSSPKKKEENNSPNVSDSSSGESLNNQSMKASDQDEESNEQDESSKTPSTSSSSSNGEANESQNGVESVSKSGDASPENKDSSSDSSGIESDNKNFQQENPNANSTGQNSMMSNDYLIPEEEKQTNGENPSSDNECHQNESQSSQESLNSDESKNSNSKEKVKSKEDLETQTSRNTQSLESNPQDDTSQIDIQKENYSEDNSPENAPQSNTNLEISSTPLSQETSLQDRDSEKNQKDSNEQENGQINEGDKNQQENDSKPSSKVDVSKHVNHPSANKGHEEDKEFDELEEEQESTTPEKSETEQKKELLKKFKEAIEQARDNLIQEEINKTQLHEDKPTLSNNANNFLGQLDKLPSFDQREKGGGYSIDTESTTEVDEIIIKNLINKFLKQRFCNRKEDLNVRSNSLEKSRGFLKWEVKDVIIHLETEQLTKVLNDKYGYDYSQGKNEFVPLSFYFDLSGSMSNYTNMLATVAIELLKKDVKVLIGHNEHVEVQIDSLDKNITVKELTEFLENLECRHRKIKYRKVANNLDYYLINHKAEKVCVFADFDPRKAVCNLSHHAKVYWFCFESSYKIENLANYDGFIYPVCDLDTIADGLKKVNAQRFEALIYTENPKKLRKVIK